MKRIAKLFFLGVSICALTSTMVFAQGSSQISGRVTDQTGAVLPGVDITLTQSGTGLVRTTLTNETGAYTLPSLNPAQYRLEISLPGFQTFVQTGIVLQINADLVFDAALAVGQVAQTIEVVANSEIQVETRTLGIGQMIENERILELPLNGRNVTDLITLSGAAVQVGSSPGWAMSTGIQIQVAGGAQMGVTYTLDGAQHTNSYDGTSMPMPFPNALQEFRVNTSSQEAGQGRASGAAVTSVTKSGTNEFHGDAFWFVRNAVFNAREADAASKDQLKRNQYGGTIGGPIVSNKLFFFTGYQGTKVRQAPSGRLARVPTQEMLAGDWTEWNSCYNTRWRDADLASGTIDPARYSPAALLLAAKLPAPNGPCGEIRFGAVNRRNDFQSISRVDYQVSDSQSIFGRYMVTHNVRPKEQGENLLAKNVFRFAGVNDLAQSTVGGHTWLLNPTTINNARFTYNRIGLDHSGNQFFSARSVGINIEPDPELPDYFSFNASGNFSFGSATNASKQQTIQQVQFTDDVSLTRGTHQISFGTSWAYWWTQSLAHVRSIGNLSVNSQVTGNSMGDFLLGELSQMRMSAPNPLSTNQYYFGLYAQDTWRATPNLTFNYGLRWEPFLPMAAARDLTGATRMYNFSIDAFKAGTKSQVFPIAPAGFSYPAQTDGQSNDPGFIGTSGGETNWKQFAPRVGLSWDPTGDGRTSIRAGFGIAYEVVNMMLMHNAANVSPWSGDTRNTRTSLDEPWTGFPGGDPFPFDFRVNPLFIPNSVFVPIDRERDTTYVQSWNLNVQHQVAGDWLLSVSYLGSSSVNLWATEQLNPGLFFPGQSDANGNCSAQGYTLSVGSRAGITCSTTRNTNNRRELRLWAEANGTAQQIADTRLFSTIDPNSDDGTGSYHGLLASIRGGIAGLNIRANYTWSHCISDRVNFDVPGAFSAYNVDRDRGNCEGDRRHIWNLTLVARTPEFANPGLRAVASDWRLSVINRLSSGRYFSVTGGNVDFARTGNRGQRVNQILDNVFLDQSGDLGSQFWNRAAFANPAVGTFGNLNAYAVRGLKTWDIDVALTRGFDITETQSFEIRAEAFNITNSARPNNPSSNFRSPDFGRITGLDDPRIMQFALKYVF